MKIRKIRLQNVKCFTDKELSFVREDTGEPLSVCALVGANGSGKSAILKAIVAMFSELNKEYAGEPLEKNAIYGKESCLTTDVELVFNDNEIRELGLVEELLELRYQYLDFLEQGALYYPASLYGNTELTEEKKREYHRRYEILMESNQTGLIMYYDPFRFVSQKNPAGPNVQVKESPKTNALASNIGADGNNLYRDLELKQWLVNLDYMRLKEPNTRNQLVYEHVVKAFDLLLHPLKFETINQNGCLLFINENDGQYATIDTLSDGFKSIFSIVLDIIKRLSLAPDFEGEDFYLKEAVILIDEIDCHIHPKWQKKLIPALRTLFPNCQFIVTTHSPYILDTLQEYEVRKIGEKNIV